LLALIDNETGEEVDHDDLCQYASLNSLSIPEKYSFTMEKALKEANTNKQNFEGYCSRLATDRDKRRFD